ncbi:MAG: beta-propeller fold lactonase family protein [Candidatus Neomarinimicrobiota bacterium]
MLNKTPLLTLTICAMAILAIDQPAHAQISEFKLTASDAEAYDYFGYSVSISGDYAIVGARNDDDAGSQSGSAYIFVRDGQSWTEQAKLTASDAVAAEWFGNSVSISGDYAIVGAPIDGLDSGSAYIFVRDGQSWTEQAKLTASDARRGDHFGNSVSISGDYAIAGAWWDDDAGSHSGSAYIFVRDGQSWTEQAKLTASDAAEGDRFGVSVSISGDYAIVGAYIDGGDSGSAYVFVRDGQSWTEQAKLTAGDAAEGDQFGISVSISGDYAIAGAWWDDDAGMTSGSAYIFVRDGQSWTEQAKLTASDASGAEWFGNSVSISGDCAFVGAFFDGGASGSAYLFKRTPQAIAYVVNQSSSNVSVTDIATNTVFATVGVGPSPRSVAMTPDGAFAYVTNYGSNTVSVIATASNTVVATVSGVGTGPIGVAITPDGAFAYVTNYDSNTVSVIATASNTVVATVSGVGGFPQGVAIIPDGSFAYVANFASNTVSVIATASNTVVATVSGVGPSPTGVAITPDGAFAYVANFASNTVSVIATASNTVVATVSGVGARPIGVAITLAPIPINNPPELTLIGDKNVDEGELLQFTVTATDVDGDPLSFSVSGLPSGATFDGFTGDFSYTPAFDVSTSAADSFFDIFFEVSDGQGGTDSETVKITVIDVAGGTPEGNGGVEPIDETTGGTPVTLTFNNVTQAGITTLTTSAVAPEPPSGFKLGTPATYYMLTTTAVFSSVTVCIDYTGVTFTGKEENLKLFHYDNTINDWLKVTASVDTSANVICSTSLSSLSPFAIFEPEAVEVAIDIKPGSDPNSINCKKDHGRIPVAILSTEDFDATTVDHAALRFGKNGTEAIEMHSDKKTGEPKRHEEDVDGDGDTDLIFHFRFGDTGIECEDTEATLTGETFDGKPIIGKDAIRTVARSWRIERKD